MTARGYAPDGSYDAERSPLMFDDDGLPCMPFGKYSGEPFVESPGDYLCEASKWDRTNDDLAAAIKRALSPRGLAFGNDKDTPLEGVPTGYLEWLLANAELVPPWPELIEAELAGRKGL